MNKKDVNRLSLIANTHKAGHRARIKVSLFIVLFALAACLPAGSTRAQYCNPATVSYIVRDESGKALGGPALESVYAQLPKSIGDARVYLGEISLAGDGQIFHWPESVNWAKGEKSPSLQFINSETCTMRLTEATLIYQNKKMRLIFNVEITREQRDRRPVIDSLPFQEGTFALDLEGWSHDPYKTIPAERWKRVIDPASNGRPQPLHD
jgi:hypothetical protein